MGKTQRHSSRHSIIMTLKFLLVSLVAAAGAMETPLWFIKTGLSGSFSERSSQCKDILADGGSEARVASLYPIVIPTGESADICIRFPKTEKLEGGWRHDRGRWASAPRDVASSSPQSAILPSLEPSPNPLGSKPCLTVLPLLEPRLLPFCSKARVILLRKFASRMKTVAFSLEMARLPLVVLDVAFSTRSLNK